jgi:penicillin-binding protein 2
VNATIGQGYMLANPLQLAVMASRLATGRKLMPRMILDKTPPKPGSMNFHGDHVQVIQNAMSEVVNGAGTAGRARLPIDDVLMAGKTGTAQVVGLNVGSGKGGIWKHRDHGLFIFFAPFDNPRYAGAVVIEHGGGSGAAYPIARDVMTFLFDPAKGMEALHALEKQWGGTAQQRLQAKYNAYAAAAGEGIGRVPRRDEDIFARVDAEARAQATEPQPLETGAVAPPPEPVGPASPAPTATGAEPR